MVTLMIKVTEVMINMTTKIRVKITEKETIMANNTATEVTIKTQTTSNGEKLIIR